MLVTPAQAAKVTLASEMGKIRLVMRSPEDNAHAEDATAKPEELLGRSAYADRKKETAMKKRLTRKKGLLDLLNQMKANMPVKQTAGTSIDDYMDDAHTATGRNKRRYNGI